ncbi:MAG: S26 family signal peptidase [Thermosipho sp. (in: Bacteria)]|nr:S26 family signal peptidase [Thermosipho sp. (in: thermotogales)]
MIVVIIIAVLIAILYIFPLARVIGNSMYPILHEGDILLCSRIYKLKTGNIYVYKSPVSDKLVIKRLRHLKFEDNKVYCFFIGDNPEESYDSRNYGYVNAENIIARVIWQPKH